MRIAYILYLDLEKYDGVANKIVFQIEAWGSLGNEVKLFCIVPKLPNSGTSISKLGSKVDFFIERKVMGATSGLISGWFRLNKNQNFIVESIKDFNPDIVYYRNAAFNPLLNKINYRYVTVSEINTLEFAEYRSQAFKNIKYFLRFLHFIVFDRFSFRNLNGIIGVTHEIVRKIQKTGYKDFTTVIPNSIEVSEFSQRKQTKSTTTKEIPNLVFIGTPGMAWHGIDRIIKIAERSIDHLNFHIIGYTKRDYPKAPINVKFHGVLPSSEAHKIISSCDIGIGTMALYRKKMEEACPLKVRECLASGLPMILAYEDTAFINNETHKSSYPDFILKLPNHQHDIENDTFSITEFSKKNIKRIVSEEEIASFIDVYPIEKMRLDFLNNVYKSTLTKNV